MNKRERKRKRESEGERNDDGGRMTLIPIGKHGFLASLYDSWTWHLHPPTCFDVSFSLSRFVVSI